MVGSSCDDPLTNTCKVRLPMFHKGGALILAFTDIGVLWIESEQTMYLKVGCPNFGPVRGLGCVWRADSPVNIHQAW